MKYLKQFETQSAYDAAQSNLELPNVSLINSDGHVEYEPYVEPDPYNGHAYVDLGLPSRTKWATMNVGASNETDYGNYYKYGLGTSTYNSSQENYKGTEIPLALSADTAAQVWGGEWHMPTREQLEELSANTTYTWEVDFNNSGINGLKFTAQNGNYMFLPAGGLYAYGNPSSINLNGNYWSSTYKDSNNNFMAAFSSTGFDVSGVNNSLGTPIRPVVG